jgi:uncharacterized repeat protein (TIGR02543 family)
MMYILITIYAKWTTKIYTLTSNVNGSMALYPANKQVTYGSVVGNLPIPTRTGYDFAGWNTSADGNSTVYTSTTVYNTAANITIYAQWTGKTYTLTYNVNGGTALSP